MVKEKKSEFEMRRDEDISSRVAGKESSLKQLR